jgi:DNA polymerase-1
VGTTVLVDGYSLAFRAWYALEGAAMANAAGQETGAVFGFVSMMTRLLADHRPDGLAVAFDLPGPTFRDEIYAAYKAGRTAAPEPLVEQFGLIRSFVEALGVPVAEAPGFEADDVIATLATRLADAGEDVIVVTGDRDAFQLVADPHVRVLYNRRGVSDYALYDEAGIVERTGVAPRDYPFYAALRGDPSDHLAGVPGVGEKTAARLVAAYHDVDGLYAQLDSLSPKLRASLAEHEGIVRRNLELIPLVRDVETGWRLEELRFSPPADRAKLEGLFALLDLRGPASRLFAALDQLDASRGAGGGSEPGQARLGGASGVVPPSPRRDDAAGAGVVRAGEPVELLEEPASARSFLGRAGPFRLVVVDLDWSDAPGRSVPSSVGVRLVPSAPDAPQHVGFLAGHLLGVATVRDAFGAACCPSGSDPAKEGRLVGHRVQALLRVLLEAGTDAGAPVMDTAVAAYVLDAGQGQATLEELAARRSLELPRWATAEAPPATAAEPPKLAGGPPATSERTAAIVELAATLEAALISDEVWSLYDEIERPLERVLARMEVAGVAVDVDRLAAINTDLTHEADRLEALIWDYAGEQFNVNSTPQLRRVLFERLGLAPGRRTKTGSSTDAQTLERLRAQHPIVDALLSYRQVEKLRSTYGEGLIAEVAEDGRIHASFNQTVARTGRLSSDRPNLHNIPVRTEEGRRFREAFVAPPGSVLLVADYDQIELRVIAHLSGDPGLLEAFETDTDVHTRTASRVFGVKADAVTPELRSRAKMISYGLAYGMEAYGLAQRLGISMAEATAVLEQYFRAFPAVRAYMERSVAEARERGYTATEFGRRRYLPELNAANPRLRQAAERQAMNAGIQGLAADIFKVALVRLDAAFERGRYQSRIVLQVHDEVLVEVPQDELDTVSSLVEQVLCGAFPLRAPLRVHLAAGPSWAAAKER